MSDTTAFPSDPAEAYKAGWDDQKKLAEVVRRKRLPALYALLYPAMAERAKELGYALALHGTLGRDMDVIAVPWTEAAADPPELANALGEVVATHAVPEKVERAGGKPHGRLGWVLHLEGGAYIDVSVIPPHQ